MKKQTEEQQIAIHPCDFSNYDADEICERHAEGIVWFRGRAFYYCAYHIGTFIGLIAVGLIREEECVPPAEEEESEAGGHEISRE